MVKKGILREEGKNKGKKYFLKDSLPPAPEAVWDSASVLPTVESSGPQPSTAGGEGPCRQLPISPGVSPVGPSSGIKVEAEEKVGLPKPRPSKGGGGNRADF
jgi:hypothetical protein